VGQLKIMTTLLLFNIGLKTGLLCFPGHPTQWQNMTLAEREGHAQSRVGKNSVSVLVDHF